MSDYPWKNICYGGNSIGHCGSFQYGKYYEFLDKYNNIEIAKIIKTDYYDSYSKQMRHFYEFDPPTKKIKIEDIFGFRELQDDTYYVVNRIELTAKDLPYITECDLFEELVKRRREM